MTSPRRYRNIATFLVFSVLCIIVTAACERRVRRNDVERQPYAQCAVPPARCRRRSIWPELAVDTLNGDEFTVFAPTDDAFAKIDAATIEVLKTDSALLSGILTYHVIPGQIVPDDIEGTHTTVNGADLEVTGSGDSIMVNGQSAVICAGVQTANATVYLIDTVLMPPAM